MRAFPALLALSLPALLAVGCTTGGEKIIVAARFPDTETFHVRVNVAGSAQLRHLDAGYRYKAARVLGLPLLRYEGAWCGYLDNEHYVEQSREELEKLAASAGVTLPRRPPIPFLDHYGPWVFGPIAALLILAGIVDSIQSVRKRGRPAAQPPPVAQP